MSALETLHQAEGLGPVFLAFVRELDARLQAPKQIGGQRETAARGMGVADFTHHVVDAENFLDDDDAWAVTGCGRGEIAAESSVRTF